MNSPQNLVRLPTRLVPLAAFAAVSMVFSLASTASAQQAADNAGGQQGGGLLNSDVGLSVDEAFDGGIERGGTVGQAQTAVGSSGASTAAGGAGGGRATGGGGLGGFGGGLGAAFGNIFGGGGNAGSSSTPALRTRLRSAISVAPRPSGIVRQQAAQTLQRAGRSSLSPSTTPGTSGFRGVSIQIQDRTAILTGTVTTDRDRRMAELMMRLEPGVSRVDNRLQTGASP